MSSKGKVIYKCAVNGDLGRIGRYGAICGKSNARGGCGAHGNTKCEHKLKQKKNLIDHKVAAEVV